jgi:hypothetical protein
MAKSLLSSSADENEDENLPPEPTPHIPPPLSNEDNNLKVSAKPFVPSGLPFTQYELFIFLRYFFSSPFFFLCFITLNFRIIRNAKKFQDGESAYYMQPHVPSLNYVPHAPHHVIPPPQAMHPGNHVQPHHHQQHAHAMMYKNPNEYRGWAGNNKKEIDQSQYELDITKILSGENSLTALMVKNIPNRYTQDMILETIGERHAGLYDFFYLPIDFKVCLSLFLSCCYFVLSSFFLSYFVPFRLIFISRTSATSDTSLSISSIRCRFQISIWNSTKSVGLNLIARKYEMFFVLFL